MTLRAEVQELIDAIETGCRDFAALAIKVHRVAKTSTLDERRALFNCCRTMRETIAKAAAAMLAEVAIA